MFDKLKQLFELQKKAQEIKRELGSLVVESEALEGQIKVKLTGEFKIADLGIDSSLLKEDNRDLVVDGLKNCLNEAHSKVRSLISEKMKASLGGGDIPGL